MPLANIIGNILGGGLKAGSQVSAFDDLWGWWRADDFSGGAGTYVLNDKSENGRNMTQAAGTLTPGTAANGQARFVGNATARFTNASTLARWPMTVITIGLRAAGATMGFFGHQGASPFNSFWHGYETTNRNFIYHTNATNNTTAEAGTTSCYVARVGYGSRVALLNGLILADNLNPGMVNASAAVTIGTEYRGLNGEWQECLVWNRTLTIDELDEVHTYINDRYGMSIPLWSSYTPVKVILLRGQSNAGGRGDRGASDANIPAEYKVALTGVNIWGGGAGFLGTGFSTLDVTTNNHNFYEPTQAATFFGPELTLGKEYIDRVGGSVYLIKTALGSTWMTNSGSGAFWEPTNNSLAHSNQNRWYNISMRSWWLAMRVLQQASQRPTLIGDIFYQGEQDATNETIANLWAESAAIFFTESDKELGVSGKKLVCRVHTSIPEPFKTIIRTEQDGFVPTLANSELVNVDTYATRVGDPVHLGPQGQLDLGTYLAGRL